jgi:hypothetical protein
MKLIETLSIVAWATKQFGSAHTGGPLKMRDIRVAKAKGLVTSAGLTIVLDENGMTKEPEQHREGFVLTEAGKQELRELDPAAAAMYLPKPPEEKTPQERVAEALSKKTANDLLHAADWDNTTVDNYVRVLMVKCPHPFGC